MMEIFPCWSHQSGADWQLLLFGQSHTRAFWLNVVPGPQWKDERKP